MVTYTDNLLSPKHKKKRKTKNNNKPIPLKPNEVIEVKERLKTAQEASRKLREHLLLSQRTYIQPPAPPSDNTQMP